MRMRMLILFQKTILFLLVGLGGSMLFPSVSFADGSRELHMTGPGQRAFLEYQSGSTIGIPRRNTIYAYAKAGERIYFGSSNLRVGSTNGITYIRGDGSTATCTANALGRGLISTYTQEQAGPSPLATVGYSPCFEDVTTATQGIWQFSFLASGGNPPVTPYNGASGTGAFPTSQNAVAAWDVTVASGSGTDAVALPGRVWTRYLPMNMGANGARFYGELYVITQDGYLYKVRFNGLDPFGFILFSNNRGFYNSTDTTSGSRYYRSVNLTTNDTFIPPDTVHLPTSADTSINKTNYIIFDPPNPDVLTILGISNTPREISIVGIQYTPNSSAPGGTFQFGCDGTGTYYIGLITNPGQTPDRVILSGVCQSGTNTILWNGLDAFGQVVPNNGCDVPVEAYAVGGEVHFPLIDAERNLDGLVFARLNGTGATPDNPDYVVYWNDTGVQPSAAPIEALDGITSAFGAHRWATATTVEDHKGADTWAFVRTGTIATNTDLCALAVTLALFEATARPDDILIQWETASEVNNLGFNLWRATTPEAPVEQLNGEMIPAQSPGGNQGHAYEWVDAHMVSGTTYYYWLEDIDFYGVRTFHGPVSAAYGIPTTITINTLQSSSLPTGMESYLGSGFLLLVGVAYLLNRLRR
jgi:hypothetical protein